MKRIKHRITLILSYCFIGVAVAISIFPFVWTAIVSIKPEWMIYTQPTSLKFTPTLQNYMDVFTYMPFVHYFLNSLIVAIISSLLAVAISFPTAYSISRFGTGGENFAFWILSLRMLPPIVFGIPMYALLRNFGLIDTVLALIVVYLTFNIPIAVWILRSFVDELPKDIEEAALLDGCSRIGLLLRIIIPLCAPAIFAVALICFSYSWNEFFFALILTYKDAKTVPVALMRFVAAYRIHWGQLAAGGMIFIIPPIALAIALRKYLVRALALGMVKG